TTSLTKSYFLLTGRKHFCSRTSSLFRLCAWRDLSSSHRAAGRDDSVWVKQTNKQQNRIKTRQTERRDQTNKRGSCGAVPDLLGGILPFTFGRKEMHFRNEVKS
uniref:Uncharacterized protein n=1 Tax=Poecilia latipinna TaxID=48699 RepID=A0A3B3UYF7_9TELE